jgi:hypothetical protein
VTDTATTKRDRRSEAHTVASPVATQKPRLCYRSNEMPVLLGIGRATWYGYVARGFQPPPLIAPGGHIVFYAADTVARWLSASESEGRLISLAEYRERFCGEREDRQ